MLRKYRSRPTNGRSPLAPAILSATRSIVAKLKISRPPLAFEDGPCAVMAGRESALLDGPWAHSFFSFMIYSFFWLEVVEGRKFGLPLPWTLSRQA